MPDLGYIKVVFIPSNTPYYNRGQEYDRIISLLSDPVYTGMLEKKINFIRTYP